MRREPVAVLLPSLVARCSSPFGFGSRVLGSLGPMLRDTSRTGTLETSNPERSGCARSPSACSLRYGMGACGSQSFSAILIFGSGYCCKARAISQIVSKPEIATSRRQSTPFENVAVRRINRAATDARIHVIRLCFRAMQTIGSSAATEIVNCMLPAYYSLPSRPSQVYSISDSSLSIYRGSRVLSSHH
jgi:hypothetical protein